MNDEGVQLGCCSPCLFLSLKKKYEKKSETKKPIMKKENLQTRFSKKKRTVQQTSVNTCTRLTL